MEIDREVPPDPIDRADYFIESVIDDHVKEAMRKAAEIPKGTAGECVYAVLDAVDCVLRTSEDDEE